MQMNNMHIFVFAEDYGQNLAIPAQPNELVRSIKAKIDQQMGPGRVSEDEIDSLNFGPYPNHKILDCSTPLFAYGIGPNAQLRMGRRYIPQATPVAAPVQAAPVQTVAIPQNRQGPHRFWNPVQGYHYH